MKRNLLRLVILFTSVLVSMALFAACQDQERAVDVEAPFDMATPYPTYTPLPTHTPYPTPTPPPVATPYPTYTPLPTHTPYPTPTPPPAATPYPTYTPFPTPSLTGSEGKRQVTHSRLGIVRDRGTVTCASRNDVPGWGYLDAAGNNVGFDIDLCRAVAAAVLGDPTAVEINIITAAERESTILSSEVDMMVRTVTWTTSRDALWGNFAHIMFYDGQSFMVRKDSGMSSALELRDTAVCVVSRTTTELFLKDFSDRHGLNIEALAFESTAEVIEAYRQGHCDAFTNDRSQLGALSTIFPNPDDHLILPGTISEEPMGPVVPHGDDQWFDIVKTVMAMLIHAEAYGIASDGVPNTPTGDYNVDRLLGFKGSFRQDAMGLPQAVARNVIRAVGNYGEIYDRNLGVIGLVRENSRNALWDSAPCTDCPKGGQIYAPPLR